MEHEIRFATGAELRIATDSEGPKIEGYAAVFNTSADIGGMFTERVMPGAFRKTLMEADIRALWNHNPDYVLGRNKSGTLRMIEDEYGLKTEIHPVDAQWSRDLQASMKRGDVNQMSFAFQAVKENWDNETNERQLLEVRLFDVSVVTYPAYPQATAHIRASLQRFGMDAITGLLFKASRGAALTESEQAVLLQHIELLQSYVKTPEKADRSKPGNDTHSEPAGIQPETIHWMEQMLNRAHQAEMTLYLNTLQQGV